MKHAKYFLKKSLPFFIYFFILGLMYFPCFHYDYAFGDDWYRLNTICTDSLQWGQWETQSGRPLYGALLSLSNFGVSSYTDLKFFRFLYFLTIFVYCSSFYYYLSYYNFFSSSKLAQFLLPLIFSASPAYYLYGAWFICFPYGLGLIFSLFSYYLLKKSNGGIGLLITSYILLSCSFAIYQPAALMFVVYLFLDEIYVNGIKKSISVAIKPLAVLFFAMLTALLMVKLLPYAFHLEVLERAKISWDITSNLLWFFGDAIPFSLKALTLLSLDKIEIYLFGFIITLFYWGISQNPYKFILLVCLTLLSYSSQLAVAEKWLSVRTSITLICLFLLVIFASILKLLSSSYLRAGVLVVLSFIFTFHTAYVFYHSFIEVSQKDYAEISEGTKKIIEKRSEKCINLEPRTEEEKSIYYIYPGSYVLSDELGMRSSGIPWAWPGMLNQIRVERGGKPLKERDDCLRIQQTELLKR